MLNRQKTEFYLYDSYYTEGYLPKMLRGEDVNSNAIALVPRTAASDCESSCSLNSWTWALGILPGLSIISN
ncbi:Hypothetical predicted protein [Cloeon dipterum]|uniref:Uncharacterized protein n=1 Tax=Cloeon dipterum TaxID=197152 RepID=A0A8S1DMJ6_9INSE|nr:Hypothetical predicted protein [Cloeon dipterum]